MPLSNNTFDFAVPSLSTGDEVSPRLLSVQFGGKYKQVEADGINNVTDKWSVVYTDVPRATWKLMDAFLRAKADGSAFLWLRPPPFDDAPVSVRCVEAWKPTWDKAGLTCSATVTLEEV